KSRLFPFELRIPSGICQSFCQSDRFESRKFAPMWRQRGDRIRSARNTSNPCTIHVGRGLHTFMTSPSDHATAPPGDNATASRRHVIAGNRDCCFFGSNFVSEPSAAAKLIPNGTKTPPHPWEKQSNYSTGLVCAATPSGHRPPRCSAYRVA